MKHQTSHQLLKRSFYVSKTLAGNLASELWSTHNSSSILSDPAGAWSSLWPKDPGLAVLFSVVPVPSTSLIRPEDSAIRRRRAFSSAVETLARCFFSGLPRKPSTGSVPSWVFSGVSVSVVVFGGVMERSAAGGVVPEAGVLAEFSALLEPGSAECWRLSCEMVSVFFLFKMARWNCTHANLANTFFQLSLALDVVGRQELVVFFILLIVGLAKDSIIVVIVIAVHFIVALLAFASRFLIPEIQESHCATGLEGSKIGKVRLQRFPLR